MQKFVIKAVMVGRIVPHDRVVHEGSDNAPGKWLAMFDVGVRDKRHQPRSGLVS